MPGTTTSNISQSAIQAARAQWAAGDNAGAWNTLAQAGDRYADNAGMVLGGGSDAAGQFFHDLVQNHWNDTVGADVYAQKFNEVAGMHLDNYLKQLEGGSMPNTQNILDSYQNALFQSGVNTSAAFDGVWAAAGGGSIWGAMLGMDLLRITTSNSNNGLTPDQARAILGADFARTLVDTWNRDGITGLYDLRNSLAKHGLQALLDYGLDYLKSIGIDSFAKLISDIEATKLCAATRLPKIKIQYTTDGDPGDPSDRAEGETKVIFIPPKDPLALDLNRNGKIDTVGLNATNPILFDDNGSGIKQATGWVASGDGFLVLDRNGNGQIDNGTELFGNNAPLYDTNGNVIGNARDGFAALAQEDTNGDGVVNNLDANFANLQVWQDLNQDGISQADELTSLADAGIASLNVSHTPADPLVSQQGDNYVSAYGGYTRVDGTVGNMADVNLALDPMSRSFTDSVTITAEAQALPMMQGSGSVRDLREAASMQTAEGATLLNALTTFAASSTGLAQHAQIDALIQDWVATSTQQTSVQQAARQGLTLNYFTATYSYAWNTSGQYVETANLTPVSAAQAAHISQMLNVLETFGGMNLANQWGTPAAGVTNVNVPLTDQLDIKVLEARYNTIKDSIYGALTLQTRLKPYMDSISLSFTPEGGLQLDMTAFNTLIADKQASDPQGALIDLIELHKYAGDSLSIMGRNAQQQIVGLVHELRVHKMHRMEAANDGVFEVRRMG